MTKITLCAFSDESASDLTGQIENLRRNNVYYTELRSVDGKNVSDLSCDDAKRIYSNLSDNGIKVWSLGSPLGKIDVEKPFCEHENMLIRLIETAKIMKTDKIRMFSYFVKRESYALYRDEVIARLHKLADIAEKNGITLCHENESSIYGATVDNCLDILSFEPRIKCVFDPANFIMWDEDIPYAIEKLANRTLYFHIKDVIRSTKQIVPAGFGDGDIDLLVKKLNRDATFTIEPHLHVFAGYSDIDGKKLENKFSYPDQPTSFNAATDAFKTILKNNGFTEEDNGTWIK